MFATTVLPVDRRTGSEVASSSFVEEMRSSGHRVEVIGYRRPGSDVAPAPGAITAGTRPIETRGGGVRPAFWLGAALARRLPYSVAKYRSRGYARLLRETVSARSPDLLVIDHAQTGWVLPVDGLDAPVALLAHNVEHELYDEAGRRGDGAVGWLNRREARLIRTFEQQLVARVDRAWTLTEPDAAALGRLGARAVRAFPLPPAGEPPDRRPEPRRDVGILGTWTWDANAIGLRWFIEEVRPLLAGSVTVAVAGAGSERWAAGDGVAGIGRVDDAASFLRSSRIVAIPSLGGGGIQIKTLDAIASGAAVVATPAALRGIDGPPPTVRIVQGPREFAAAIARLLDSPPGAEELATARDWVRRRRDRFRSTLADELTAAIDDE